jgi:hypothetical protein
MKVSSVRLAIVFLYCLAVLYGVGYVVFYKGASAWWFLAAGCVLPRGDFILRLAQEEPEEPEE